MDGAVGAVGWVVCPLDDEVICEGICDLGWSYDGGCREEVVGEIAPSSWPPRRFDSLNRRSLACTANSGFRLKGVVTTTLLAAPGAISAISRDDEAYSRTLVSFNRTPISKSYGGDRPEWKSTTAACPLASDF